MIESGELRWRLLEEVSFALGSEVVPLNEAGREQSRHKEQCVQRKWGGNNLGHSEHWDKASLDGEQREENGLLWGWQGWVTRSWSPLYAMY